MPRIYGTGSIYAITDRPGWRATYSYTDRDTGQRKTASKRFTIASGASRSDAEEWLNEQVRAHEGGRRIGASRREDITVRDMMTLWLRHMQSSQRVQQLTFDDYVSIIRKWITPTLGGHLLKNLDREDMLRWLRHLERQPSRNGQPLSWQRRRHCFLVMKQAMNFAVGDGYLDISPLVNVPAPRRPADRADRGTNEAVSVRARAMTEQDLTKFVRYLDDKGCDHANNHCQARWLLAIAFGIRGGEARGLKWSNYNARTRTLTIDHHLQDDPYRHGCGSAERSGNTLTWACGKKMGKSCPSRLGEGVALLFGTKAGRDETRAVKLSPYLHRILMAHRKAQAQDKKNAAAALRARLKHLNEVRDEHIERGNSLSRAEADIASAQRSGSYGVRRENLAGLIFTSAMGREISKHNDWETFCKESIAAGLSRSYRLHDLRHTAVTQMVNGEASPALVMQVVGHRNLQTTMLYATPSPEATAVVTQRHADALERLTR